MTSLRPSPPAPNDPIHAERIGSVVRDRWSLDALLGAGGMAAVYAATDKEGSQVAIKILHAQFAGDVEACARFRREFEISKELSHPSAVRVVATDDLDDGVPFLVVELLHGETVREAWRRAGRQMPLIAALQIAERVVECLGACHAQGIVHRDLKPANLFVTIDSRVKVLDFGVAQWSKAAEPPRKARWAFGTPAYMSPEQAMGRDLDGRADLFSVGALLHALITGHRINAARTESESLKMAASRPVPSVRTLAPNLPIEVIRLIDRALEWDRGSRFTDANEMQEALLEALGVLGGEPLASRGGEEKVVSFALSGDATKTPMPRSYVGALPSGEVAALRTLFVHVDAALALQENRKAEPGADMQALRRGLNGFHAVLGTPSADGSLAQDFSVDVLPYGFASRGSLVWEPPRSLIPHRLFEAGVRQLQFRAGMTPEELREWVGLTSREHGKDLPPDDDVRSLLWERELPHLHVRAPSKLAVGTWQERERFLADVERVHEAVRGAVEQCADALDAGSLRTAPRLLLDDETREEAGRELSVSIEEWTLRYLDVLAFGYAGTKGARERERLLASLRKTATFLLRTGRLATVASMYHAIVGRLGSSLGEVPEELSKPLAEALLGGERTEMALRLSASQPALQATLEAPLSLIGAEGVIS